MNPVRNFNRRLRARHDDEGAILILVLIFLTVFSLILGALLSNLNVNLNMTAVNQDQSQLQYAADAGIEWGINQLAQPNLECPSGNGAVADNFFGVPNGTNNPGAAPFTLPSSDTGQNINVTVNCTPVTGVGSGTFGGYSVVTGMNYPAVPGYPTYNSKYQSEEKAGTQTCTSFSADPIGSGAPTYATQVTNVTSPPYCLSYPTSSNGPVWNDSDFSGLDAGVTPGTIQAAYAVNNGAIFGVGAPPTDAADSNSEGIYFFNNDDFTYVGGATTTKATLNGVWAPANDPNDVWTVGDNGTILYCSASCTSASAATWTAQTSGTAANLYAITGTDTSHLWAAGVGTLLFGNGSSWSSVFPSKTTGSATIVKMPPNLAKTITSSTLFTGSANYVGWAVSGTGIPNNTKITAETNANNTATMSNAASQSVTETVTLTPPSTTPTFNDVWADASGDVWAVGVSGAAGVVYECPSGSDCSSYANWVSVNIAGGPNSYSSITGSGSTIWAVGASIIEVCSTTCTTPGNWSKVTLNGKTLNSIVAADTNDVWAVGNTGGNTTAIVSCASSCSTGSATWSSELVSVTEGNLNTVTAVPSALRNDPTTWGGAVWAAGVIPNAGPTNGTGWAVYSPLTNSGQTLLDLKGGNVLNGGYFNVVTPMKVDGGNVDQYSLTGSCQTQPSSLTITNGAWSCKNSFAAISSLDEPLPSQAPPSVSQPTGGLAYCVFKNNCIDMSTSSMNVNVPTNSPYYNSGCKSFTEFFPGYYKSPPKLNTKGGASLGTNYFASGVYYFAGGGWGAIDSGQTAGAKDGTVTSGAGGTTSISVPASDNVLANAVGYAVTDSADVIGANATIQSVSTTGGPSGVTTAILNVPYTAGAANDTFTVANPAFVIGGQPGAGDTTDISANSPCWNFISHSGQQLDSNSLTTGFHSLGTICGTGATQCTYPAGAWFEGSGATSTPNGTGVDWILGGGTWFDVHTVDMELFTRDVPLSTLSPAASASSIAAQVTNEGTQYVSMREIPPVCPAGSTTSSPDNAVHPGPYCVLSTSLWAPLNPGNNQALQIDANNHDPLVYIHGAIYMPDNDMTLFTNQPQRDVWVGAIDVNSLELTYDSAQSPAIQIISGGSPQTVQVEFIAQATDAVSGTSLWEEAVFNEKTKKVQSWRLCNGPPGTPISSTSFASACQT